MNRAYSRKRAKSVLWPDGGWTQESPELEIHLTEDDPESLTHRSTEVHSWADALDQFLSRTSIGFVIGKSCGVEFRVVFARGRRPEPFQKPVANP